MEGIQAQQTGDLKPGSQILIVHCLRCGKEYRRENVAVGDDVVSASLIVMCGCGNGMTLILTNPQNPAFAAQEGRTEDGR